MKKKRMWRTRTRRLEEEVEKGKKRESENDKGDVEATKGRRI